MQQLRCCRTVLILRAASAAARCCRCRVCMASLTGSRACTRCQVHSTRIFACVAVDVGVVVKSTLAVRAEFALPLDAPMRQQPHAALRGIFSCNC